MLGFVILTTFAASFSSPGQRLDLDRLLSSPEKEVLDWLVESEESGVPFLADEYRPIKAIAGRDLPFRTLERMQGRTGVLVRTVLTQGSIALPALDRATRNTSSSAVKLFGSPFSPVKVAVGPSETVFQWWQGLDNVSEWKKVEEWNVTRGALAAFLLGQICNLDLVPFKRVPHVLIIDHSYTNQAVADLKAKTRGWTREGLFNHLIGEAWRAEDCEQAYGAWRRLLVLFPSRRDDVVAEFTRALSRSISDRKLQNLTSAAVMGAMGALSAPKSPKLLSELSEISTQLEGMPRGKAWDEVAMGVTNILRFSPEHRDAAKRLLESRLHTNPPANIGRLLTEGIKLVSSSEGRRNTSSTEVTLSSEPTGHGVVPGE